MKTKAELCELTGRAWQILLWVIFGFFALIWLRLFCSDFLPRFGHLAGVPIGPDAPCLNPECDFAAFWPAGLLARSGNFLHIYDPYLFQTFQRKMLYPHTTSNPFLYPPFTLLSVATVSWLPFETAFFVWTGTLLAGAVFCLRYVGVSWRVIAFGIVCPAALWSTLMGQLSVLVGSILIAGWSTSKRMPVFAGSLMGLLACKPQAGLLIPFVLLIQKNYRSLIWFFSVVFALFLLSVIMFGPDAWLAYYKFGKPASIHFLTSPFVAFESYGGGISVFWMMRSLGADVYLSFAIQSISLIAAIFFCFKVWRDRTVCLQFQVTTAVLLSLLASPYGYINDMFAGSVMLAVLAERRGWKLYASDVIFWLWPVFCNATTLKSGILFTPLVVIFSLWRISREAGMFSLSHGMSSA